MLTVLIISTVAYSCTAFMAAKGDKVLIGRNADSKNLKARMLVLPSSELRKYGVIFLGQQGDGNNGRGAFIKVQCMNDQGLWYGSTALYGGPLPDRNDIKNYYNKPIMPYDLITYIMENCTTVDEAIEFFATYYYPVWNGHHLFVDEEGNSVIIEFGEKDVVFMRKKGDYQVMTNFPNAYSTNARWYNCYRYKVAESMLENSNEISIDLFRSVCDATHQEGSYPTSLSIVYDLKSRDFYLYYFHNYEEFLKFNVDEMLQKGENYYKLPELFNQINLRFPINGEKVNQSSLTFLWNGNAESYNLYYSTDMNFMNVEPVIISAFYFPVETSMSFFTFCFGSLIFGVILIRKKKTMPLIIGLTIVSFFLSCEIDIVKSPFTPSTIEHHQTVENLQSNDLYYWKVEAIGSEGINSESIVQTFKTKD